MRQRGSTLLLTILVSAVAGGREVSAQHDAASPHGDHHASHPVPGMAPNSRPAADITGPAAGHSEFVSAAFAPDGRLCAAWVEGGRVWASSSRDRGATWATAVRVSTDGEDIDANGEARPKVASGFSGEVYVTYTRKGKRPFTGEVRFARSLDGGATFSPPLTVNAPPDESGHRFDTVTIAPDGAITLVWIDKRDRDRETASGRPYAGAALYAAISTDRGATFSPNRKLHDHACECCRIAVAGLPDGRVALLWRHVFGTRTRDHALALLDRDGGSGPLRRATFDNWELDGCPHHGPALAAAPDGTLHLAWFSGAGTGGKGIFYARTDGGGVSPAAAVRLPGAASAGHPAVLATASAVWVAWVESGRGGPRVMAVRSSDGGRSLGAPVEVASTETAGDHPQLLLDRGQPLLVWFTDGEGLVVVDLDRRLRTTS